MPCIHDFDENSCPLCLMQNSSVPKTYSKIQSFYNNPLKPISPFFTKQVRNKQAFKRDLTDSKRSLENRLLKVIPELNSQGILKDFSNTLFLERLEEIDVSNQNKYGIAHKVSLESPEYKLEKKE
ncbi:MAG: hypothetical protein GF383_07190 [Candidatus Lokiarchaeota archaeon]|nr:hypothetical protein [Candidatus Lokiarchaeota archaeon]MBD3339952.1 hypothetical protein [Candidatus Lokiarchaeota archaeon]